MRPQDWPALLVGYIDGARRSPFAWGSNDCVSWACGWHKLMTGRDVFEPFRGKYDTEADAFAIMAEHGVKNMDDAARFLFGTPNAGTMHVGRGDIAFAQGALGICVGGQGAFLTLDGLAFLRHAHFELGWSIA